MCLYLIDHSYSMYDVFISLIILTQCVLCDRISYLVTLDF